MRPHRTLTLGLLLGLLFLAAPTAAAQASAAESVLPAGITVSDEPWSSPDYPVTCKQAQAQVTCTPTDPNNVVSSECFREVSMNAQRVMVCTTYAGHKGAIQADGGRAILVQYGCSFGDAVCLTFENAGRGLALAATGAMFLVADNMRFDTSTLLWSAAVNEWSFWQWAILAITFGAMCWGVAAAVISRDREELVGVLVRSFLAIPAVPLTLWATGHLLNAVDDMTWYVTTRNGPAGMFSTFQSVMFAGGQANYFFAFLIHGLLMIGMMLLMLVFAFRNIVLAALIMVGPVAWMLFPVRGIGPQWVVRYVSAVVALLLTGPLTIGFVALIVSGLADVKTIWDPQSWPLLIGLVLVAFAPFALFGLFSFTGAVAADAVGSRLGSQGSRAISGAARSAARIPTRMGGRPSGIPSTGGASGPPSRSPQSAPRTGAPSAPRRVPAPQPVTGGPRPTGGARPSAPPVSPPKSDGGAS